MLDYPQDMDVTISWDNLERIGRKVRAGGYSCADDVVDRAMTLLDDADDELERELAGIRATLAQRMENRDPGNLVPAEEVFAELHRRNAAMRRQAE